MNELFIQALKKSKSIGEQTGWIPKSVENYTFYEKHHSYGEYIFDWQWAQSYESYGLPYYPKLLSMLPFTPVNTTHFGNKETFNRFQDFYNKNDYHSSHFLFVKDPNEKAILNNNDYLERDSLQYHFTNRDYKDFDNFLSSLKSRKAKEIRKERILPKEVQIKTVSKNELTKDHALRMYYYYFDTVKKKGSYPYLTIEFFFTIFESMKENIFFIEAFKNEMPVAGTLFFYDENDLYGRYWGCHEEITNLHFELCYYQGIEFCIKNNISNFEAGAQGEHKIKRGFRPTIIKSYHNLKNKPFHEAIKNYIVSEKKQIQLFKKELDRTLPFK